MELALHRMEVGVAKHSEDMVAGSLEQVHSANKELMSKQTVHTRCSTECQMHLGNSWSGQNLQISVSADERESGDVSWTKEETC